MIHFISCNVDCAYMLVYAVHNLVVQGTVVSVVTVVIGVTIVTIVAGITLVTGVT